MTEFTGTTSAFSSPGGITTGPDGNLWFTAGSNRIGRITPAGVVTEFSQGISADSYPKSITAGPDGNVWFTENGGNPPPGQRVARISPEGVVTEFSTGITPNSSPAGITTGPDGNLWFVEEGVDQIGRITPTGTVAEFPAEVPINRRGGISAGSDGNVWFAASGARLGRISPQGNVTYFPTPGLYPADLVTGSDGSLWFTAGNGLDPIKTIGRMTVSGDVQAFNQGFTVAPLVITAGPDGNIWFTDGYGAVGRLTLAGVVTQLSVGPGVYPFGITAGPDDNIWFTKSMTNRIVRLVPSSLVSNFPAPVPGPATTPTIAPTPTPAVARLGGSARLLVKRVKGGYRIRSLRLTGLDPAAWVRITCVRGCVVVKGLRARARTRELRQFFPRPLRTGSTLAVRVTKPAALGRYFRWTIRAKVTAMTQCDVSRTNVLVNCSTKQIAR
jgi:streptogramin lyase